MSEERKDLDELAAEYKKISLMKEQKTLLKGIAVGMQLASDIILKEKQPA